MNTRLAFAVMGILCAHNVEADVEFFFNTSPSDPPKLITSIAHAFPLASVGHGTLYVSSACRDEGQPSNLIRPCTERDPQHGLVISFDVDLQKNTGHYFLAVTRDEFFYGNLDKDRLPPRITRAIIDDMDAHFFRTLPILSNEAYFKRHVEKLSSDTKLPYDKLADVLVAVSYRGVSKANLRAALKEQGMDPEAYAEHQIWNTAKYFEKNGISPQGMSRRVVTWAVRFYQGVWGFVYPTTQDEELALIEYINSLDQEDANILSVNCVMPLDIAGGALTGSAENEPPRNIYVPYFVLKRIVKGAFEADVEDVNEFGEFIRRPGAHMEFYPQIDIPFDEDVPRAPKSVFQKGELVKYYQRYQSEYANYLDWLVEQLLKVGVEKKADTIAELRELRKEVYAEEVKINKLEAEYEGAGRRDAALKQRIDRLRTELLDRHDDALSRIMGTQPAIE